MVSVLLVSLALAAGAQTVRATGSVEVLGKRGAVKDASNVVVWLTPRGRPAPDPEPRQYRLVQRNKQFEPHLLIVPLGAVVEFPNKDPLFHNVFSVYEGTPFDLGLYESGSSKPVRFDRPGPSYIFCNIHPEMSAVVLALKTPYYAVTNAKGEFSIDVPPGEYDLGVWYERTRPEALKELTRRISLSAESSRIPRLKLSRYPSPAEGHKNKYGQTYEPPPQYPIPQ